MSMGDWITAAGFLIYVPAAVAYGLERQYGKCLYFIGATLINVSILKVRG